MQALRMQMLEDCTFSPQIGPLAKPLTRTCIRTSTTNSGESVFSRLYRGGSPRSNTRNGSIPQNETFPEGNNHIPTEESSCSTLNLGVSRTVEGAYQKGVTKIRAKPIYEQHEEKLADKEKEEFTSWPKTKSGLTVNKESTMTRRSTKLVMQPLPGVKPVHRVPPQDQASPKSGTTPDLNVEEPPLPKEIIVTSMEPNATRTHPWGSLEHHVGIQPPVSPLRELSLVQTLVMKQTEIALIQAASKKLHQQLGVEHEKGKLTLTQNRASQHPPDYGSI